MHRAWGSKSTLALEEREIWWSSEIIAYSSVLCDSPLEWLWSIGEKVGNSIHIGRSFTTQFTIIDSI